MDSLKREVETAIEEGACGIGNGSTAECEGGSMTRASVVALRTWTGGPLRQMAPTKVSSAFIPYAKTINGCHFARRYVCDGCQQPCGGVSLSDVGKMSGNRLSKWLCDSCRTGKTRQPRQTTPEQIQAAIHRLAAARRDRATSVRIQGKEDVAISKAVVAVTADVNPAEEVYGAM
jgi:hypothetical protein